MRRAITFLSILTALVVAVGASEGAIAPPRTAEASPTTTTVYWGNYPVNAFTASTNNYFDVQKPCVDCYLTIATPQLEYNNAGTWEVADYTNGAMLHHMVIFNHAYIDPTCGGNELFAALGDRFFASGNERGTLAFAPGYGYYLPPASTDNYWNLNVMIHNLSPDNKMFRLKMDITYHPATDNLKKMRHIWLDQNNCSNSQYSICPTGPYPCYDDRHWDWTVGNDPSGAYDDIEGTITAIGGHVHDWGISVAAEKVQTGQFICTAVAGYAQASPYAPPPRAPGNAGHPGSANSFNPGDPDYNGHIEDMTGCSTNVKIKPGDTIRLHAQYNSTLAITDVMGIMGAWIYDNCDAISNPDQHDTDGDLLGEPCDPDIDGDAILNGSDTEADGDGLINTLETAAAPTPCTARASPSASTAPISAWTTTATRRSTKRSPAAPSTSTATATATRARAENHVSSYLPGSPTNGDQKRCQEYDTTFPNSAPHIRPSKRWPSDVASGFFSGNKINVQDLSSFTNPVRYLGQDVGTDPGDVRFDLIPGSTVGADIGITDLAALTTSRPASHPCSTAQERLAARLVRRHPNSSRHA